VTARKAAGVVYGPLTQGAFLRALGIELRAEQLRAKANLEQSIAIDSALERLTAGDAMGRLFKVMAITAPGLSAPAGFEDLHSSDDST